MIGWKSHGEAGSDVEETDWAKRADDATPYKVWNYLYGGTKVRRRGEWDLKLRY